MSNTIKAACAIAAIAASNAGAQWDPNNALWGKTEATDIRVMTWNVEDGICRTANKSQTTNNWAALVRTVAALEPDILILQEAGDNSGNNTGSGVDSVSNLTTTLDLFFNGGNDPFQGGAVTQYVQAYRPGYDLPHIYVSNSTDNFNRNVILSRWPFADLNGDNKATVPDFVVGSNATPISGGDGGIRGFQFAEIDLPNDTYLGDLVVGNGHLKAGGNSSDFAQRLDAAENIWYYARYFYNGNGTSTPDPENAIISAPNPTQVLNNFTPIIMGGDLNEDEVTNGRRGPAAWMTEGPAANDSTTGVDADGTDGILDASSEFFSGDLDSRGSSKLDHIIWQDSIAQRRRSFIFQSAEIPFASMPPEIDDFGFPPANNGTLTSSFASDHFAVIADFIVPLGSQPAPGDFDLVAPADGANKVSQIVNTSWTAADDADFYEIFVASDPGLTNVVFTSTSIPTTSAIVFGLDTCTTYYWSVLAHNSNGATTSTPAVASFTTIGYGDQNNDGIVSPTDFTAWVNNFNTNNPIADVNQDGSVTPTDFTAWINAFNLNCP